MKKLIFVIPIFLILFASCSTALKPLEPQPRKIFESFFDYSEYAKEGFMISPDPYVGNFDACGEIIVIINPASFIKKGKSTLNQSLNKYETSEYLEDEVIHSQELLRIFVDRAKSKGANAITNFRYTSSGYHKLSGFAIKRK